jgi:hypothetical protein
MLSVGLLTNNELLRTWKEAVGVNLGIGVEGLRKTISGVMSN